MSIRRYHIVAEMYDEYHRVIGFELEYFDAGEHLPFESHRRHNRATIGLRFDNIVKQKKMIFANESDKYTALLLLIQNSQRTIPVLLFEIGWREGEDINDADTQQDTSQPYYVADSYKLKNAVISAMSVRVPDRVPNSDLDLIDVVIVEFEDATSEHFHGREKRLA
jgi:type VI protein secretion system component Hcp